MGIPGNYNSTVLVVRFQDMKTASDAVRESVTNVMRYIREIESSLAYLRLSWTGHNSADKMQQFAAEWADLMTRLFGTEDDPGRGILIMLADGVAGAAANYAQNESNIKIMFNQFEQELGTGEESDANATGGGEPGKNPTDVVSGSGAPVTTKTPAGGSAVSEGPHGEYHTTAVNESGFEA